MARSWPRAVLIVIAVAVVGAGAAFGFTRSDRPSPPGAVQVVAGPARAASLTGAWEAAPPPPPTTPTSFTVADAAGPVVHLYESPGVPLADKPALDNPTWENLAVVFLVLKEERGWLQVRVSSRPNNLTAWVQASEVRLREVPNRVLIEVGARRVTVLHGDEVLLQEQVAVGSDATPTPIGNFFVDGAVRVPNAGGPYGPYQVSVSGFSNVLQSFGGGVGQIAMHGTNRPELIGQPVSNGCIRMPNEIIAKMVDLAPSGTPVDIVP
jgi:lipoprotein-anchoring transpeptidase ErfK/SrfK